MAEVTIMLVVFEDAFQRECERRAMFLQSPETWQGCISFRSLWGDEPASILLPQKHPLATAFPNAELVLVLLHRQGGTDGQTDAAE